MGGHGGLHKTKYYSIDDIPDSMVKTFSRRDPDNPLYRTRRWVNFKKRQILFSQNDGVPNYLRTPYGRFTYYTAWATVVLSFCYNVYAWNKYTSKK